MGRMILPDDVQVDLMTLLCSVLQNNGLMGLFTNDFTPTKATVLADFVEPIYNGYGRVNPPISSGVLGLDGGVYSVIFPCYFQMIDDLNPTSIFGMFATDQFGTLVFSTRFDDAPVALVSPLQILYPYGRYGFVPPGFIVSHS